MTSRASWDQGCRWALEWRWLEAATPRPSISLMKQTFTGQCQGPGTALRMGEARKNSSALADRRILEPDGLCGLGQVTKALRVSVSSSVT